MQGTEIRFRRVVAGISGDILCHAAGISRSRLSVIERGYVAPDNDELKRITAELNRLTTAKARVDAVAAEVGWPTAGVAA